MSTIYDVLRRPMVTEKTNDLAFKLNQYVFEVQVNANRTLVKEAVESIFKVNVVSVNIIKTPGKSKRNTNSRRVTLKKPVMKKAIVTLAAGEKIPFF